MVKHFILQTYTYGTENSADPDKIARNELAHQSTVCHSVIDF